MATPVGPATKPTESLSITALTGAHRQHSTLRPQLCHHHRSPSRTARDCPWSFTTERQRRRDRTNAPKSGAVPSVRDPGRRIRVGPGRRSAIPNARPVVGLVSLLPARRHVRRREQVLRYTGGPTHREAVALTEPDTSVHARPPGSPPSPLQPLQHALLASPVDWGRSVGVRRGRCVVTFWDRWRSGGAALCARAGGRRSPRVEERCDQREQFAGPFCHADVRGPWEYCELCVREEFEHLHHVSQGREVTIAEDQQRRCLQ